MSRPLRTVVAWNMKVGRGRAAITGLRALIRDTDADVVLLQEAKNYIPAMRVVFGVRWRLYAGPGLVESSNCAILARRSLRHGRGGKVRNEATWVYRKGSRSVVKEGRVWRWRTIDGIPLMSLHRATNGLSNLNGAAGEEEATNLIDWAHRRACFIVAGDWNNRATDRRPNGPAAIATLTKGELVTSEASGIDFALVRGVDVSVSSGEKYGSDHRAHIYRLRRP